jgi:hypothetical protein
MFPCDAHSSSTELVYFLSRADFLCFGTGFFRLLAFCVSFCELPILVQVRGPGVWGYLAVFEGGGMTVEDVAGFDAVVDDTQSTVEHAH